MTTPPTDQLQSIFDAGVAHHQAGRLDEAERAYDEILAVDPSHAGALNLLGMVRHQAGEIDRAVELIGRAVAREPGYAQAHNNLGNALKDQGEIGKAIAAYRRALDIAPDYAMAHNNLGIALAEDGKATDAIACYRCAIGIVPDYAMAHYNLGNALKDLGRNDEAIACYERAIEIVPTLAQAHHNQGVVLAGQGQTDAAAARYEQAIEIAPDYAEAHFNLAKVLQARGEIDAAIVSCQRTIEIVPAFVEAHRSLGNLLRAQGELDAAIACYRRTIDLAPDCADAHYALSTLLDSIGQPVEAKRALEEACRLQPIRTEACTTGKPAATILKLIGRTPLSLKDGRPAIIGGNLDTSMLLDRTKFTIHALFVHRDNLLDMAGDLPPHDIVLNGIVDPDLEMARLNTAQAFIARQDAPFINDPAKVRLTSRDTICQLLTGIDNLVVPKVVRATLAANDPSLFMPIVEKHGLRLPLIVRPVGGHVGYGMVRVDGVADFENVTFPRSDLEFYLIEFHDFQGDDGYYRKMRFYFVDGKPYPNHLLISNQWNIHSKVRHEFMKNNAWMTDEENSFLEDPDPYLGQEGCSALEEINRRIGLDAFGVDYAMLPNGKLLLFEANACMQMTIEARHADFPYYIRNMNKIKAAFEDMVLARLGR